MSFKVELTNRPISESSKSAVALAVTYIVYEECSYVSHCLG